jgi:hypothetical protein
MAWSLAAKTDVDIVVSPPARFEEPAISDAGFGTMAVALLEAFRTIASARRGEPRELSLKGEPPADIAVIVERARGELALAHDDPLGAIAHFERGIEIARIAGLALDEVLLLSLVVDARLLLATRSDARLTRYAVAELKTFAEGIGATRFIAEARLGGWLALAPDERDAVTPLELADSNASPIASRRAKAILGQQVVLDALDRRIVETATRATLSEAASLIVLDLGARALRLPAGSRIDLSASELGLRILEVLARMGGRASKEALVKHAWQQSSYHPHKDDRRLHVAIHRLRHVIENEPTAPELILRDGDDYRLAVPIRVGSISSS